MLSALIARSVLSDAAIPELTDAGRAWLNASRIDAATLESGRVIRFSPRGAAQFDAAFLA